MRLITIILLLTFATLIKSEIFSSIEELADLYSNQEALIEEFEKFIKNLKNDVNDLKSKLKIYKDENVIMKKDVRNYIINPLNAFLLIKSLSYDVGNIQRSLQKTIENFSKSVVQIKLPVSDLEGAIEGFYRLQYTYNLKSSDLAKGIIQDQKFRKDLRADDLFVLGKGMIDYDTTYAEEYLRLALEKNEESKVMDTEDILQELFTGYNASKKYNDAIKMLQKMTELDPDNTELAGKKIDYELKEVFKEKSDDEGVVYEDCGGTHHTPLKEKMIFAQACRGERLKSPAESSKLYCFMQSNTPFTKIAPFKVEIANFDPYVVIFHEILSDNEIEAFKNLARPRLARAAVMTVNKSSKVTTQRVAKLNWLYDVHHEMLQTLTRRVGDMSGLNMKTAEAWQVQNYGIGGHYVLHQDFSHKGQQFNDDAGNRIATTLFYLSDVEKGGATVFPFLRLYVPARKGTAVFWHNLSSSGDREYITMHGACPVLVGSKWVSNKWLHEYGQERARPCELVEKQTDEDYWKKVYVI